MDELHNLRELIEDETRKEDISEQCMLKLLLSLKKLNVAIQSLNSTIELLNFQPKLDLISLLFKEGTEQMNIENYENVYIDLAYSQFRKLRDPTEDDEEY